MSRTKRNDPYADYKLIHSYARFSSPEQATGDSKRRQKSAAEKFSKEIGLPLSDLRLIDEGRSAFSKKNKQYALADFLRACEDQRVVAGDILLIENVDRLSRRGMEHTRELVSKIVKFGVGVQALSPSLFISGDDLNTDISKVLQLAIAADLAHQESRKKSERLCEVFSELRRAVSKGEAKDLRKNLPAWLVRDQDGNIVPEPEACKTVRYIFRRTAEGIGAHRLLKELNEKYEPFGWTGAWTRPTLQSILRGRAVLGEVTSSADANFKVANYYPQVIDTKLWKEVQVQMTRNNKSGGGGKNLDWVNIFKGFLFHPVDQTTFLTWNLKNRKGHRERRYRSRAKFNNEPNASPETYDVTKFENLFFELLPKLDLSRTKTQDPTEELKIQRAFLQNELKAMDDLIERLETKGRSIVKTLEKRSDTEEQLGVVEKELEMTRETKVIPTKKFRKELSQLLRGSSEERLLVRQRVMDVVKRVDLYPVRLATGYRPTIAIVEIAFHNGEFVRAIEVDDKLVAVRGKENTTPLAEQCKAGYRMSIKDYGRLKKLLAAE